MSGSETILDSFATNLQRLLEATISEKSAELKRREETVKEREDKINHFLNNHHAKGYVELHVGSTLYCTSSDILLKVPDSYFHIMLNKKFQDDKREFYFIARDGDTFKYVLEYLTYGRLFSIPAEEASVKKLLADADFYLLPGLAKEITTMMKEQSCTGSGRKVIWMRVGSQQGVSNQSHINWTSIQHLPSCHFVQNGATTTILQAGLYHIFVRYEFQCSTQGQGSANVDLLLNGTAVARVYHGKSDGYHDSRSLEYLGPVSSNSQIQVLYKSNNNGNPYNDHLGTTLTIICLEEEEGKERKE